MKPFSNSPNNKLKISIIGAGNLAWHLILALDNAGYEVSEIYSRNPFDAEKLAQQVYQATVQNHLDFSQSVAQLFIIAVADQGIEEVAQQIILPTDAIVVHTSGTIGLQVLSKFEHSGVMYPIQTFSKQRKVAFKNIPIAIEASDEHTQSVLAHIAETLTGNYTFLSSEERKIIHLAAVFACNFTNHLLGLAHDILDNQDLDMSILKPLITETINKALHAPHPFEVQTGPAVREDKVTIDKHLDLLSQQPGIQHIYQLITQQIQVAKFNKK